MDSSRPSFESGGSIFNSERPLSLNRLFNRQVDRSMDRPFQRPIDQFDRPGREFRNNRPWQRRQKRELHLDNNLDDDYLDHLNYKRKTQNQLTTLNPLNTIKFYKESFKDNYKDSNLNALTTFKPLNTRSHFKNKSIHNLYYSSSSNLKVPTFSSIKLTQTTNSPLFKYTTPSSLIQSTSYSYDNTSLNSFDNPFNSYDTFSYNSTSHHYYHQAYLLFKYFKLYKNRTINEIRWSSLPEEIKDKFKMLILSLRYAKNALNGTSTLEHINEDFVIAKALEIVKWKGWEQQKAKRKDTNLNDSKKSDFKPIVPADQIKNDETKSIKETSKQSPNYLHINSYPTATSIKLTDQLAEQNDEIDRSSSYSNLNPTYSFDTTTFRPLTTTIPSNDQLKKVFENIEDIRINHSCSKPKGRLINLKEINYDYRFYLPK